MTLHYYLDKYGITEISETDLIYFMLLWFLTPRPYILYECHKALGHNGSTRLYHFIRKIVTGKIYMNIVINMCVNVQKVNK